MWLAKDKKVVSIQSLDDPLVLSLAKLKDKLSLGEGVEVQIYKATHKAAASKWSMGMSLECTPCDERLPLSGHRFENGEFMFVSENGVLPWSEVSAPPSIPSPASVPRTPRTPRTMKESVTPVKSIYSTKKCVPPPPPQRTVPGPVPAMAQTYQQYHPHQQSPVKASPQQISSPVVRSEAQAEVLSMRAQLQDMQQSLSEARTVHLLAERQAAEIATLKHTLSEAQLSHSDTQATLSSLQTETSALQEEVASLRTSLANCHTEESVQLLHASIRQLQDELHGERSSSVESKVRSLELKEEAIDLRKELDDLRNDRSGKERAVLQQVCVLEEEVAKLRLQVGSRDRLIATLEPAATKFKDLEDAKAALERKQKDPWFAGYQKPASAHWSYPAHIVKATSERITPSETAERNRIHAEELRCRESIQAFCQTPLAWLRGADVSSRTMLGWNANSRRI